MKKKTIKKKRLILKSKKPVSETESTQLEEVEDEEQKSASQPLVTVRDEKAPKTVAVKRKKDDPSQTTRTEVMHSVYPDRIFKFYCKYCGQKLSANENAVGCTTVCPTCDNKLGIPAHVFVPQHAQRSDVDLNDIEVGMFKFHCMCCKQKLEVRCDWSGKRVDCPTCKARISVPPLNHKS